MTNDEKLASLKAIIETESESMRELSSVVNDTYLEALNILAECTGKVVISGVGKSGHIGRKMAATFSSTGTPSFFMHSTEGVHGDLGMITKEDVVILISNSGETAEVLALLPTLRRIGSKLISITSNETSTLAKNVDRSIIYRYQSEADHLKLAPTTSALMTLAIGDAFAVTLSRMKDFNREDFHLYHPGGSLGKQLEG